MKRRPDWIGDAQRREAWKRYEQERRARRKAEKAARGGKTKFEAMTSEEREQLRKDLLAAHDTIDALIAEMSTPEALDEAARMRDERQKAIDDLKGALQEAGEALAERFPGIKAEVPGYDDNGDEFWLCFDGKHLLWFEPRHGMKSWAPVRTCPLRVRIGVPHSFHALMSALVARRWVRGEPDSLCTAPALPACTFTHLARNTRLRDLQE